MAWPLLGAMAMRRFSLAVVVLAGLAGSAAAQPKAAAKPTFDEEVGALLARPGGLTAAAAAKRAVEDIEPPGERIDHALIGGRN